MKNLKIVFAFLFILGTSLFSCGNAKDGAEAANTEAKVEEKATTETTDNETDAETDEPVQNQKEVVAKFVEFSVGDFEHLIFETPAGETIDFMGYDMEELKKYPLILMKSYEANPEFLNKTFKISYTEEEFVNEYDGGSKDVALIIKDLEIVE